MTLRATRRSTDATLGSPMMRAKTLVTLALSAALSVAGQALAADAATLEHGNHTYQFWCAPCHGPGHGMLGPQAGGLPGTLALSFKYKNAKPAVLEERTDLDPALVKTVVRHGIQAMPPFRKTEVSDADLDAIAAYLARNNK